MVPEEKTPTNVFRYVSRDSDQCPVCLKRVNETYWSPWAGEKLNNSNFSFCHPLKRISVSGIWWWKKKCPVAEIHNHLRCDKCKINWIYPVKGDDKYSIEEEYLTK